MAYEGFDYLLEKFQSNTQGKPFAVVSPRAMNAIANVEIADIEWGSEEEGLLMRAWDDI